MKLSMVQQNGFWSELFDFFEKFTIPGGLFALLWKTIDKVGAHYAQKRKDEMKELIKEEVNPHLERMDRKIDDLHDMIFDIKKGMK